MVIFHSYVSFPEGKPWPPAVDASPGDPPGIPWAIRRRGIEASLRSASKLSGEIGAVCCWLRKGDPVVPVADIYIYIYIYMYIYVYNVYTYIICIIYIYIYIVISNFYIYYSIFFGGCCTHTCSMYDLSTDLGDVWGD